MELLARASGLTKAEQELSFMAGMFSLLGVLFGLPLSEVLKPLQVSSVVLDAVLRGEGDLGALLRLIEFAEYGDGAAVGSLLADLRMSTEQFNLINLHSHAWMIEVIREAQGGGHA
jgi:EAL and modified HD-GYP domain-containing signal transduction protein